MNNNLDKYGYEIINNIYSSNEVNGIIKLIDSIQLENSFGEREFLFRHPEIAKKVFTTPLLKLIKAISINCNKSIKSIYFDKPPKANWVVNWHQDLTINLKEKADILDYKNWRINKQRVIVQPNIELLEKIFIIRIHLDDCKTENGALNIIKSSHNLGVIQINDWIKTQKGELEICEVPKGGVLVMKPLILHSSKRTKNLENRRVIHIEFTDQNLPSNLEWKEEIRLPILKEDLL